MGREETSSEFSPKHGGGKRKGTAQALVEHLPVIGGERLLVIGLRFKLLRTKLGSMNAIVFANLRGNATNETLVYSIHLPRLYKYSLKSTPSQVIFRGTGCTVKDNKQASVSRRQETIDHVTDVCVRSLAGVRRNAGGRASPANTTTLSPVSGTARDRWCRRRRGHGRGRLAGGASSTASASCEHGVDLGLDEGERGGAVLGRVTLMSVGVVAVAAVWVGRIAVRLDVRGVRALEASRARCELCTVLRIMKVRVRYMSTHPGSLAGTNIVGQAWNVARVTHEDCSSNLCLGSGRDGDSGAR